MSKGVDGLIVNTTSPDNDFLYGYQNQGIPIVLCDRKLHNYNMDIVGEDNEDIISVLVHHLKEQGYTRIALMTQENLQSSAKNIRKSSFLRIMEEEFNYDANEDVFLAKDETLGSVSECIKAFMSMVKKGEIPAIIGANSVMTMLAFRATKDLGYIMPDEIGLCGTNSWSWNESTIWMDMLRPTVSCVKIHGYEIGQKCASRILEKIENPSSAVKTVWVNTDFVPRESTLRKK